VASVTPVSVPDDQGDDQGLGGPETPFPDAPEFGRSLPSFCANLLVTDPRVSAEFYRQVLGAVVRYVDEDFAAIEVHGTPIMLHADRTYAGHPWYPELRDGLRRGLGAELRLFGVDPDPVARAADRHGGLVLQPAQDKPHGWRETIIADPDGYSWAIGTPLADEPA
jgi:uncharacterized glyoxalase superfamily protein PhnB